MRLLDRSTRRDRGGTNARSGGRPQAQPGPHPTGMARTARAGMSHDVADGLVTAAEHARPKPGGARRRTGRHHRVHRAHRCRQHLPTGGPRLRRRAVPAAVRHPRPPLGADHRPAGPGPSHRDLRRHRSRPMAADRADSRGRGGRPAGGPRARRHPPRPGGGRDRPGRPVGRAAGHRGRSPGTGGPRAEHVGRRTGLRVCVPPPAGAAVARQRCRAAVRLHRRHPGRPVHLRRRVPGHGWRRHAGGAVRRPAAAGVRDRGG